MVLLLMSLLSTFILAGHISTLLGCSSLYSLGCSTCTQYFDQGTNRCIKPTCQPRLDALDPVSSLKSVTFRTRAIGESHLLLIHEWQGEQYAKMNVFLYGDNLPNISNRVSLRSFLFLQLSVITFYMCARRKR